MKFGFFVKHKPPEGWRVALPHQCDDWEITLSMMKYRYHTLPEAVKSLEFFIAEAQEALEALKEGREFGWTDE